VQDKKAAALVALLVALPALVTAGAKWIEADAANRKAAVTRIELQEVLDNYADYIVEKMQKGCP